MATGSIREKKTKSGEIHYQITIEDGYDELTGKRVRYYKNVNGNKREAKSMMHKMIAELAQGNLARKSPKKMGEWMDEWLSNYLPNIEETTRKGYKTKIRCYIKPAIGDIFVTSLRTEHIQKMINDMKDSGLSPKNIRDTFNNINAALKKAVKLRIIPHNPCDAAELPKLKKYRAAVYPPEMIQKVLDVASGTDMYLPVFLLVTETIIMHCNLLLDALKAKTPSYELFSSSSYSIVSYVFKDKLTKQCSDNPVFTTLLKHIHTINDPRQIIHFKEDSFPTSKNQNVILKEYLNNKYKQIDSVDNSQKLWKYLKDADSSKTIDNEYLRKVCSKFNYYISNKNDVLVEHIFYSYMLFLFDVQAKSPNIDSRLIHSEMIRIQKLWEDEYYEDECKKLHVETYELSIPTKEVEAFNDLVLMNPIVFANNCIPCSEEKILNMMEFTSENVFSHFACNIEFDQLFPRENDSVNFERHDIDEQLLKIVSSLIEKRGYKLLNIFAPEIYVKNIHDTYKHHTKMNLSAFLKEQELYEAIKRNVEIELLPYSSKTTMGLVSQLFPVLEMKIRELSTLLGIFPFKKNKTDFMMANDPSSLLRELLDLIYEKQHSFENVPDFLYIYHIMYNSNSLNIRNDFMHGRKYLTPGGIKFAFRATLLALSMVIFRITTIRDNVSDLAEDDEE